MNNLNSHLTEKNLHGMIPPSEADLIARHAESSADAICSELGISPWATPDLTTVGLYDIVVFCGMSSPTNTIFSSADLSR